MKISLNWIKEYLQETKISVEDLTENIKQKLAEVEEVENLGKKYQGIVVAQIVEKKDHPNADKLGVYIVNDGERENIQVVAGDKDLKVGDKVAYLPPETKVPNNPYPDKFDGIIKKTKLRGVDSDGMLASEKELGISGEHERVLVLDSNYKIGESIGKILDLDDDILEIENKALTNRPDTFGIIGIARDVSGMFGKPFKTPEWISNPKSFAPTKPKSDSLPIKIDNKLETLCPRYMAISMSNVNIKESPLWLKAILSKIGLKPINNVVDITNYLMTLTGQPLHAFDYDKLKSKDIHAKNTAVITIRTARKGEKITTLDGKTLELNEKAVVICDSQNPVAIGGVMGGLNTEIDSNTKNIIIESANFDLYNIRQTSMTLGLFTDAATRYSKGQDPNLCEPVLYKAIELLTDLCDAKVASSIQDKKIELPKTKHLTFSLKKLNNHIGLDLKKETVLKILNNINLHEKSTNDPDLITLVIPTFRPDLQIPEDIHEEVARLYGYNNIPITLPRRDISAPNPNSILEFDKIVRNSIASMGGNELLTYNFVGQQLYNNCNLNLKDNYKIINPISPKLEYMRSSLIPSLFEKINVNINNGFEEFLIFEINRAHNKLDFDKKAKLPIESRLLSIAYTKNTPEPYYNIKYYVDSLFKKLNIKGINYEKISDINKEILSNQIKITLPLFDINRSAIISNTINGKKIYIGTIGEPSMSVSKNLKFGQPISMVEIDMAILRKFHNKDKEFINFSKYPKIQQDLCFVLNPTIPYIILEELIKELLEKRGLNYKLAPIDIYQKDQGVKQITIRITLQHQEKTLKEKDIKSIREIIEKTAKNKLEAKIKAN